MDRKKLFKANIKLGQWEYHVGASEAEIAKLNKIIDNGAANRVLDAIRESMLKILADVNDRGELGLKPCVFKAMRIDDPRAIEIYNKHGEIFKVFDEDELFQLIEEGEIEAWDDLKDLEVYMCQHGLIEDGESIEWY